MLYRLHYIIFLLLCLGCYTKLSATHLMGGDIMFECLGDNEYRIILKLYRDCSGVSMDLNEPLGYIPLTASPQDENASCDSREVQMYRQSVRELSPLCPDEQSNSTCNNGDLVGTEEYIYEGTVTLSDECEEWFIGENFVYRNEAITNLDNLVVGDGDMHLSTTINTVGDICNSSPQFINPPVPYICNEYRYNYSHLAVDEEGDSLVYRLVNPRNTFTDSMSYVNDYADLSSQYPMETVNGEFNINPNNGMISFTPTGDHAPNNPSLTQSVVLTVMVEEYRDGELLGSILRDIQIVVMPCDNQPPYQESVQLNNASDASAVQLEESSFRVCAGDNLSFDVEMRDDDPGDVLTLRNNLGQVIPAADVTSTSGNSPITGTFEWQTTTNDVGSYDFNITVRDNACPLIASNNYTYNVNVTPPMRIDHVVEHEQCDNLGSISVSLLTSIDNPAYNWAAYPDSTGSSISNLEAGTYTLTIEDEDGVYCDFDTTFTVEPPEFPVIQDVETEDVTCAGPGSAAITMSDNQDYEYSWNNEPFTASPTASFEEGQHEVIVRLVGTDCTVDTIFTIGPPPVINIDEIITADETCSGPGSAQVTMTDNEDYEYSWNNEPYTTNNTTSLEEGEHEVSIRLAGTVCIVDTVFSIGPPPAVVIDSLILEDVTCSGPGSAEVITDGEHDYEFSWNNGPYSADPTTDNLSEGAHNVSVRIVGTTCLHDTVFNIGPAPVINIDSVVINDIDCSDPSAGSAEVLMTDNRTYEYSWNNGPYTDENPFELDAGTHEVNVRLEGTSCTDEATFTISTFPNMAVELDINDETCSGPGNITVNIISGPANPQYTWPDFPPSNNGPTLTNVPEGTYDLIITDQDEVYCDFDTSFQIEPAPEIAIDSLALRSESCDELGTAEVFMTDDRDYEYAWNGGPYSNINRTSGLQAGTHNVRIRLVNTTCVEDTSFRINPFPGIEIDSVQIEDATCTGLGQAQVFMANDTVDYEFSWNGAPFKLEDEISGLEEGIHTVTARYPHTNCTDEADIVIESTAGVALPNAFSPNGDNIHEDIGVLGNPHTMDWIIYNRWGEVIFRSKDPKDRWDGTYRGEAVPIGIYPYRLKYECINAGGEMIQQQEVGEINLMR